MSRVGKYPVEIPQGVQVAIAGGMFSAKGRLGELKMPAVRSGGDQGRGRQGRGHAAEPGDPTRMMWGTTRALIANMVKGVSAG